MSGVTDAGCWARGACCHAACRRLAQLERGHLRINPSSPPAPPVPAAGRLLLQRLRKSQSTTVLYGEPEGVLEQLSLQDGGAGMFPQMESGSQARSPFCLLCCTTRV